MTWRLRHFLAVLAGLACTLGAAAADDARVLYPGGTAAGSAATAPVSSGGYGAVTILGALVLAAGGVWLLQRGRKLPFQQRDARKLAIEETRSLGSRQYLVVANYEGRKLLLGVCPGRIDLLTSLDSSATPERR